MFNVGESQKKLVWSVR